jgi:type II secretory pathway component PulK
VKAARRQSGFVLVLVLLVVAICGTIMAASARRCGQNALRAAGGRRELQFRWGASSCQVTVLAAAEKIFEDRKKPEAAPSAEVSGSLMLGGMRFRIILSDESAKANVNRLAEQYSNNSAGLISCIGKLQAGGQGILPVELRPTQTVSVNEGDLPIRYGSFDQVFTINQASELTGAHGSQGAAVRARVTFWGDGKINVCRAELPVIRAALAGHISDSQLSTLDKLRRSSSGFSLEEGLAKLQLTKEEIAAILPLATDSSNCFGVWVLAEDNTRNWCRLYVRSYDPNAQTPPRWAFAW